MKCVLSAAVCRYTVTKVVNEHLLGANIHGTDRHRLVGPGTHLTVYSRLIDEHRDCDIRQPTRKLCVRQSTY